MNDAKNHTHAYVRYLELRYKEAYEDAKALRKFGNAIRFVGIAMAVIVGLVVPVYHSINATSGEFGQNVTVMGPKAVAFWSYYVAYAVVSLIAFYIVSTVICGMSDILKATTDTSINTSPLLSNEQKGELILHKVLTHESLHDKIDREINA